MKIRDFGVEMWMNEYEETCTYNIAETCVYPLTVDELISMNDDKEHAFDTLKQMQLTYGSIEGLPALRKEIASLFKTAKADEIVTTHGAIGANNLIITTLVEPTDHVISVLPTYQQHYSIPESLGADVSILRLREENGWLPDINELQAMMRPNTKLICINNPNNPTGALIDKDLLVRIIEIAKQNGSYLLCDEVYRGLNHTGEYLSESVFDLYEKGISTGSMSKAFSLAGLRLGWIACRKDLKEQLLRHRDYNTISCGMIDEYLAMIALQNKDKILLRARNILSENLAVLDKWVQEQPYFHYVQPMSGTTAFIAYDYDIASYDFCKQLLQKKGVMLVPGSALDVEYHLRFGYAFKTEDLKIGLEKLSEFVHELNCPIRTI